MSDPLTRRDFVKAAGRAAAAASVLPIASACGGRPPAPAPREGGSSPAARAPGVKRRYAIVGTGGRGSSMWGRDLVERYPDVLEFVGLCDINPLRAEYARKHIGVACPTFTNFDEMCDKTKPDLLTVTTVDCFHSEYIIKGLDRGIDVITEKPMTTDETKCQAILDAEKRNRRKIIVTFNYRYAPKHVKMKEVLLSGAIGPITSVDFNWYLDIRHGADYFRRWHRLKAKGGSLWVHKATHHFDLVNWWLDAEPEEVFAFGELRTYGKSGPFRGTHCRACPHAPSGSSPDKCNFFWDILKSKSDTELYVDCESADGYLRDGCVYREDVDIWDTMTANVRYTNGIKMSYSLNAFMPFEGYRIAFNGLKGRLEVRDYERQPWKQEEKTEIWLTTNFPNERTKIEVPEGHGSHGGGDNVLRDQIFREPAKEPHLRVPGSRAGAMSCLTGIAARKSIEEKRPVKIGNLVTFD